jgi:N-methylhydantoinase B
MDHFTGEIIKNGVQALTDEMFAVMRRTAKSPIIYEVLDFGVGITDAQGELVAMGFGTPFLLSALESIVKAVVRKYGVDSIKPGDVFISNDPFDAVTTHLNDVGLVAPVFVDGKLLAFVAVNAHWTDVGGKDPGSLTTDSTELFQEGFQLPTIRLFADGEPLTDIFDLIEHNVRLPDLSMGDLSASVATLRVGQRRLQEMAARYGGEAMANAMAELLAYGETTTRQEFAHLPRGTFEAEDWIDDDGHGNGPMRIKVAVTIADDAFTVDFTGTAPQAKGPINVTSIGLRSAVRCAFMAITNPSALANSGCFRSLNVICPEGTLFSARRPAPVATYFDGMAHAVELVWKALAEHLPDRLTAGHSGSVCLAVLSGIHPKTGEYGLLVETLAGGWGAATDHDGVNGTGCVANGETYNIPVEVREAKFGVRCDGYGFHNEAGGFGAHTGGKGLRLDYTVLAEQATLTCVFGRSATRPWGLAGGIDGTTNYVRITRLDGSEETYGRAARIQLYCGDRISLVTGTGGGYGAPADRPRARVLDDLKNGYLTSDQAETFYGVGL